jgi:hypothetical protein
MKRLLAILLAMTFLSLTASAAKKTTYSKPHVVTKGKSFKKGRAKKGGFAKSRGGKHKGAKPAKRARR